MIKIYNTLGRKKEDFKPLKDKKVGYYTCGPTVYDYAHIGNLRTYIFEDVLRRVFKFNGYEVKHVENITDIDDKTIKRSQADKISLKELTEKYEKDFMLDLKKLNINTNSLFTRATDNIDDMVKLIQKLLDKDIAYLSKDGSIYFNISKFNKYGEFANLDMSGLKHDARVSSDEYDKEGYGDFVLWKVHSSSDGDNFWIPEFNIKLKADGCKLVALKGRPGWHIECSAMSQKYLGTTFDVHAGAVDLIFPHHQNEIAQSEAVTGKLMAKYWIHGEHLLVDGKKMAKSAGNFYTLKNIEKKGIDPLAFRYLCLESHYRSKMNFSWEALHAAQNALNHIRELGFRSSQISSIEPQTSKIYNQVLNALNDDMDTPKALALLHKANDFSLWLKFDPILGLKLKVISYKLTVNQRQLIKDREVARDKKDFALADKIRKDLEKEGIIIEDTQEGTKVIPKIV
jgi:cysteinyl-tRNA synthetase